jgi:hypothetical protein
MVHITHAIRTLAFLSFDLRRTGFTLYPVCNRMTLVPTFFGEPGLHVSVSFSLLSPGSRLLRQQQQGPGFLLHHQPGPLSCQKAP